jgi:hypothetical protein
MRHQPARRVRPGSARPGGSVRGRSGLGSVRGRSGLGSVRGRSGLGAVCGRFGLALFGLGGFGLGVLSRAWRLANSGGRGWLFPGGREYFFSVGSVYTFGLVRLGVIVA